ncbi:unnamed protein product [Closterium sp. Naga37s-1]|nr:unnamed protein product [Closterium sp. Naga37s-1]
MVLGRLSHPHPHPHLMRLHGYCRDRIQPIHLPNISPPTPLNPSRAERGDSPAATKEVIVLGRLSHPHLVRLHGYCNSTHLNPSPFTTPPNPVQKEVIVLGRLSHPHLVRLHGYCMERDEALLVYEFMTGGCLHRALSDSASGELFFSWNMRLKVAVQVAEALAYMHGLNFIHRDLKAANVLLSPEYDAKLTDFGMVRVGPEGQLESIVSTRIMGTEGYIDPTYMETGHLGAKSDVYSFGVLLLELVTGRRVVDEGSKMVTECRTRLSDLSLKAAEYVDPRLENQYPELGARTLATLARHCVAEARSSRPDIGSVLEKLKLLVKACANAEAKAAAKAAALEAGESGSAERGNMEVNGGEEGSSAAVAPVQVLG